MMKSNKTEETIRIKVRCNTGKVCDVTDSSGQPLLEADPCEGELDVIDAEKIPVLLSNPCIWIRRDAGSWYYKCWKATKTVRGAEEDTVCVVVCVDNGRIVIKEILDGQGNRLDRATVVKKKMKLKKFVAISILLSNPCIWVKKDDGSWVRKCW